MIVSGAAKVIQRLPGWNPAALDIPMRVTRGGLLIAAPETEKEWDRHSLLLGEAIGWDRQIQRQAWKILGSKGMAEEIAEFARKGGFPPDWVDLLCLYLDIERSKPDSVLEMGSGLSTFVIKRAMGGHGELTVLDGDEKWARMTEEAVGHPVYVPDSHEATVLGRETKIWHVPPGNYRYVYLDGAPLGASCGGAATVIDAIKRGYLTDGTVVRIDGRAISLFLLEDAAEWEGVVQAFGTRIGDRLHWFGMDRMAVSRLVLRQ